MVNADAGIDDIDVNTLNAGRVVLVASEGSESEFSTTGDICKTLDVASLPITRQEQEQGTYPRSKSLGVEGVNNRVLLNVCNLWHPPDPLE